MSRTLFILISIFLAAMISLPMGCATPEQPKPALDDTTFCPGRFDKVWDSTMKVLERRSLAVKDIDKGNGTITTRFTNYAAGPTAHSRLDEIAERPDVRLGLFTQVGYTLTITLTAVNDMSTQVKVKARIEAYDSNTTRKWHQCRSKGVIESGLLEEIRKSL